MGMTIDEYIDIKLQQKCVLKTIDILWEKTQKYQKITEIVAHCRENKDTWLYKKIREVLEDGKDT